MTNNDNHPHDNSGFFDDNLNHRQSKKIKGISCDVKNCEYNSGDESCGAGHIAVGPSFATSCSDTICVTFKQKET
jgi:hypothetical protein